MILANQGEGIDHVTTKPITNDEKKFFHITKINNNSDSRIYVLLSINKHIYSLYLLVFYSILNIAIKSLLQDT